jgi:hypothetical protein
MYQLEKTVILLSSWQHDDTCVGEENDRKPEMVGSHYWTTNKTK